MEDLSKLTDEELDQLEAQVRPPESYKPQDIRAMSDKQLATLTDQLQRQKYADRLSAASHQFAMEGPETTPHRVTRAVVGALHGPASSYVYNRSIERLRNDQADDSDFRNIAVYEGQQAADQQRSGVAQFGLAAAQIPGEVATMLGGGAVAKAGLKAAGVASKLATLPATVAATPTMWAAQGVERNIGEGREAFDPRGMMGAGAHATAKLAALELVGGVTGQMMPAWFKDSAFVKSVADKVGEGPLGKAALGGVSGPFTQAAADVLTSVVGIDEGYGSIGLAFQGKYGEAAKHVLLDALTFAAFAAMHGKSGKKTFEDFMGGEKEKAEAPNAEPPPSSEVPPGPKGKHYRPPNSGYRSRAGQAPAVEATPPPAETPAAKPSLAERMKERGRIGLKQAAPRTGAADASVRTARPPEPPAPAAPPEPPKPKVSAFRQKQLDTAKDRQDFIRDLHAEGYSFAMIADHPEFPHGKITRARVQQLAKEIGLTEDTRETTADDRKRDAAERVYQSVLENREANESPAGFDPEVDITERSQADARDAIRAEVLGATNSRFAGEGGEEGEVVRSAYKTDADYKFAKLDSVQEQAFRAGDMETFVKIAELLNRMETQKYEPDLKEMKDATDRYKGKKKRNQADITEAQAAVLRAARVGGQAPPESGGAISATGPGQRAEAGRELQGATSAGGRPGPGTPKQRVERDFGTWAGLKDVARDLYGDDRGSINLDQIKENLRQFRMSFEKLGGVQLPRMAHYSKELSLKGSIMEGAEQFCRPAAEFWTEHVFGANADPAFVRRNTAALVELRLRRLREVHQANADALLDANGNPPMTAKGQPTAEWQKLQDLADGVTTKVGTEFKDEADFIAAISDPAFDKIYNSWADGPAKELDSMYRRSRGFSPTDTVLSPTQIDGTVIPLIEVNHTRVDPITGERVRSREGNLRNAKIKSNERSRMAKGTGDYSVDPKQILEEAFYSQSRTAAHADWVKQAEADGLGIVGKAGARPDIGGEPAAKVDFLNPPKNYIGQHGPDLALYLHHDIANEYRDLLKTDRPLRIMGITPVARTLSSVQMLSGVDFISHVANLTSAVATMEGGGVLGVKMMPKLIRNVRASIANSTETKRELMEMARYNMIQEHGEPHSGAMRLVNKALGTEFNEKMKLDPWYATSRMLHHYNRAIRLTAREAYAELAKANGETPNEKDMVDYVSQCLNYSKATQNQFVRALRDIGIGPFATAAAGVTQKGVRAVLGMAHKQGVSSKTKWKHRAEMFGSIAAAQAIAMAVNYAAWGDVQGDDNTPWLAIKWNQNQWVDFHPIAWLVRRGSKAVGLHALATGAYESATGHGEGLSGKTLEHAIEDFYEAIAHPVIGPPVEAVKIGLTGRNTRGFQTAGKTEDPNNQVFENIRAGLASVLPVPSLDQANKDLTSYLQSLPGPFGIHTRHPKQQKGGLQKMTPRKLGLK